MISKINSAFVFNALWYESRQYIVIGISLIWKEVHYDVFTLLGIRNSTIQLPDKTDNLEGASLSWKYSSDLICSSNNLPKLIYRPYQNCDWCTLPQNIQLQIQQLSYSQPPNCQVQSHLVAYWLWGQVDQSKVQVYAHIGVKNACMCSFC